MTQDSQYSCEHCGGQMTYAPEHLGMASQCPHCQQEVVLGGLASALKPTAKKESIWTKSFYTSPAEQFADDMAKGSKHPKLMRYIWQIPLALLFCAALWLPKFYRDSRKQEREEQRLDYSKQNPALQASIPEVPVQDERAVTAQLETDVRKEIQKHLRQNAATEATKVKSFSLVHEGGNKYKGTLVADTDGNTETAEVEVAYDGRVFMWKIVAGDVAASEMTTASARTPKTWNTKELDAAQNGNILVAAREVASRPDTKNAAITAEPAAVAKTPWNYYGKIVKLTGVVAVVQDYPPDSDYSKLLNTQETAEIVISCRDETIVDMLCMTSSGSVKVGDTVNLYGYPVGILEVPNKLGGMFTHLMLVGNHFERVRR